MAAPQGAAQLFFCPEAAVSVNHASASRTVLKGVGKARLDCRASHLLAPKVAIFYGRVGDEG